MESKVLDFNVSGVGSSDGGVFGRVDVSGVYTFNTDVSATQFSCSGVSTCKGSLKTQKFETAGMTKIEQDLTADVMEVAGTCKIGSDLEVGVMRSSGMVKVLQHVKAHEIEVTGLLKVEGNIETENLTVSGQLKNKGFINAERINISAESTVVFNEMGATSVDIVDERSDSFWSSTLNTIQRVLSFDFSGDYAAVGKLIEADAITIEYAKIEVVRGKQIKIGPYCLINEVEYSETLEIHETAKVLSSKQVNL